MSPKSKFQKPLKEGNKIITERMDEFLKLYSEGVSLRELQNIFGVPRGRLTKYVPEDLKREKNEWFKIKARNISPNNKKVICLDNLIEYISASEAARIFNTTTACITRVCSGERKTTKEKTFVYSDNINEQAIEVLRFLEKDTLKVAQ